MADSELLKQYRDGVRRLLQSGAKEEVRSTVPEFQSIILEEVFSFAKKEIIGVYNCARVKLLSEEIKAILEKKKVANIDIKVLCIPHAGCPSSCDSLEFFRKLPANLNFSDSQLTIVVVDQSITLAIGDCSEAPLLMYPGGSDDFTGQALKFANELWTFTCNDGSNSISVEGSRL